MRSLPLLALLAAAPALAGETAPAPKPHEPSRHYNIAPSGGAEGRRCELQVGPNDRVAQEGDVVIRRGEVVEDVFALRGSVTVEAGGTATSVVAVGGTVTVEGRVKEDALAIRGEVVVLDGGGVGGNAVALAGRVRVESGGRVKGDVTSIGPSFLVGDLADVALRELERRGPCVVKIDPAAAARPR